MSEPTNSDDVIDSRDIIARIDELQSEVDSEYDSYCEAKRELSEAPFTLAQWLDIEQEQGSSVADSYKELVALRSLAEECEGYAPDWRHGETLIRRSYWVEYVQQLLEDIGDLPKDIPHYIEIDWDKTADNIEADYTTADFDGVEYLIRCS